MDDLLSEFLAEASAHLDAIEAAVLRAEKGGESGRDEALRRLHSLKGAAACLSLTRIERLTHAAESLAARDSEARPFLIRALMRLRDMLDALARSGAEPPGDDGDILSAVERDRLPSLADTLALARDRLLEIAPSERDPRLSALLARLSMLGAELTDATRTRPIAECCALLPNLVNVAAAREGKRIALSIAGDLAIEQDAAAPLREALTHLVRNACSHGIETPDERRASGKPEIGRIRISAHRGADFSTIEISDDGRGFDIPALRRSAIQKGVLPADAVLRMSDSEIARIALTPGISTAVEITMLSGRGIGLDAASAAIDRLGGELTIVSSNARGATFVITIPDMGAASTQRPLAFSRESAA